MKGIISTIKWLSCKMSYLEDVIIPITYIGLVIVTFGLVLCRYVFCIPFLSGHDLSLILFVLLTFISASKSVRTGEHFELDILPKSFKKLLDIKGVNWISNFAMLFFALILIIEGYKYSILSLKRVFPYLGCPVTYLSIWIVISGILMIIHILEKFTKLTKSK